MIISVFVSYLLWFDFITPAQKELLLWKNETPKLLDYIGTHFTPDGLLERYPTPTPFYSHVVYNPLLALSIYLLAWSLKTSSLGSKKSLLTWVLIIIMTHNMLITYGRTGQVAFVFLIGIFGFQFYSKDKQKVIVTSILFPVILGTFYLFQPTFKNRIDETIGNIKTISQQSHNSVSERFVYFRCSLEMIKDSPLMGVGTGDFPIEYKRQVKSLYGQSYLSKPKYHTQNPHNQYLLVLTQFGILGFILFLAIFFLQIKTAKTSSTSNNIHHFRLAFPLFFIIIFIGDSYLQTSATSLLFSSISGFLYKKHALDTSQP